MPRPVVLSVFKPPHVTSYDIIRKIKKSLGEHGIRKAKVGHFGTLDPFASGLMLIGLHGASRLNNYIHDDLTKTYLAVGKLGVYTPTGDLTVEVERSDESDYLKYKIARFDRDFMHQIAQKFVGEYWQSPHTYSAAKFQGKKLHEWAREGVEISKPPVKRFIHNIEVVKYRFPYFIFRCEVSSGTYIRTLFSDIAKEIGTYGSLVSLVREKIGTIDVDDSFRFSKHSVDQLFTVGSLDYTKLLPYAQIDLPADRAKAFRNGLPVLTFQAEHRESGVLEGYYWVYEQGGDFPIGLADIADDRYRVKLNFPTV